MTAKSAKKREPVQTAKAKNISKPKNRSKPNRPLKPSGGKPPANNAKQTANFVAETEATQQPAAAEECPRGGLHEWTNEAGETACAKCHEPAPKAAKSRGTNKQTSAKPATGKPTKRGKASQASGKPRATALDAAARVLAEAKQALTTREMIEAMAAKGYWKSPGGKTPQATLYSAILREVTTKKGEARFKRTERGKFVLRKT